MSIKYYHLAKDEALPDEFCAVRDVGGEPSEYVFYVPDAENTKLRELVRVLHWCKDFEQQKCYMCPLDGELYHRCDDIARELGVEVDG